MLQQQNRWRRKFELTLGVFKSRFELALSKQQKIIKDFLDEKAHHVDEMIADLEKLGAQKEAVLRTVDKLKVEKTRILEQSNYLASTPITISGSFDPMISEKYRKSDYGFSPTVTGMNYSPPAGSFDPNLVKCPNCDGRFIPSIPSEISPLNTVCPHCWHEFQYR